MWPHPESCRSAAAARPAGNERQKASGAQGERLKEATAINKSLSALGNVILSLVDQQHVSLRNSSMQAMDVSYGSVGGSRCMHAACPHSADQG